MTVTSFERHGVQRYFENQLGCATLEQWKNNKATLKTYVLTAADAAALSPLLIQDATALYIKALQSFAQALTAFSRNEFAWPIVKMYYSVFYAMRAELYASSVIVIKNGQLFYTTNVAGNAFTSMQEHGSHQTYIKLRKTFPASVIIRDAMLDNEIEAGVDVYSWMCNNRERVNYHAKHFPDPEPDSVLQKIYDNYVKPRKLTDLLNLYEGDRLYCFDKDHTSVAVPYHKLRTCKALLSGKVTLGAVEQNKIANVKSQLMAAGIEQTVIERVLL